mgnify:CR=1 FL=1
MVFEWNPVGVTAQFLENAETYQARYYNNDHWILLLGQVLELSSVNQQAKLRVLDIGSGSGNTVFTEAVLLPNSAIYANNE